MSVSLHGIHQIRDQATHVSSGVPVYHVARCLSTLSLRVCLSTQTLPLPFLSVFTGCPMAFHTLAQSYTLPCPSR